MAMEVLRPQGYYRADHLRRSGRGSCRYGNSYSAPRPTNRRHQREREAARPEARHDRQRGRFVRAQSEPAIPTQTSHEEAAVTGRGAGNLVTEKVTILRRGESLDSATMKATMLGGTVFGDVYAGMAFAVSPEPSCLPVPSFGRMRKDGGVAVDKSATRDLRRLLRLD